MVPLYLLWNPPYSSPVWVQTLWLEFSVGRCLCTYPGLQLSPTFSYLVDVAGSCLLEATTLEPLPAVSSSSSNSKSHLYAALISTPQEFCDLLAEYVVSAKGFSSSKPKHQFLHSVPTVPGPPVFAKARCLDAEKLESDRKKFAAMEAAKVICRLSSPWASMLHMVQKPDGSWRPCRDYHFLDTQTIPMLSSSKCCWCYIKTERMQVIYQAGFNQGILSSSNGPWRHSQDGGYHSFRSFWVGENAFRTQKCRLYFSTPHGPDSRRSPSLFRLCGRYTNLQPRYQVSSPTCSPGSWQTPPPRPKYKPGQMCVYSRKLSSAESRYSAFDRELFAAYSALRHFWFLPEGNEFVLFSDHKPLTHALFRTTPPWSAMQQRRLSCIPSSTARSFTFQLQKM